MNPQTLWFACLQMDLLQARAAQIKRMLPDAQLQEELLARGELALNMVGAVRHEVPLPVSCHGASRVLRYEFPASQQVKAQQV